MPSKTHGGDLAHPLFPHGTHGGYKAGCRCEACREAKRQYAAEWAAKARKDPVKKERMNANTRAFRQTEKGKETNRRTSNEWHARWRKTDAGRAFRRHEAMIRYALKVSVYTGTPSTIAAIYKACHGRASRLPHHSAQSMRGASRGQPPVSPGC